MSSINTEYFKAYREKLGFSSQNVIKSFFAAKDITPLVDYNYIELLNQRLSDIITKINGLVVEDIRVENIASFCEKNIAQVSEKLIQHDIIPRLNNQWRRPEEVYFSWMRWYVISTYFLKALSQIFHVNIEDIDLIGEDDLINIDSFRRAPAADLEINLHNWEKIRIEVQSGFQGVNDIKQHKVLEAKKIKLQTNTASLVIHFDLFNGQVAFVKIDEIDDGNVNWITRQQMEGQTVFNIDQNYFVWKLTETPPAFEDLSFS